jgi:hypothetical protein
MRTFSAICTRRNRRAMLDRETGEIVEPTLKDDGQPASHCWELARGIMVPV